MLLRGRAILMAKHADCTCEEVALTLMVLMNEMKPWKDLLEEPMLDFQGTLLEHVDIVPVLSELLVLCN